MGTFARRFLVACIAVTALAACGSQTTTATNSAPATSASVASTTAQAMPTRPVLEAAPSAGTDPSVLTENGEVRCNPDFGAIDLEIGGSKKGFRGDMIKVTPRVGYLTIEWGTESANTIVVNHRKWTSARGNTAPTPKETKLSHDAWTYIESISICGFGN